MVHIVWSCAPTLAPRTREWGKNREREREKERHLPPPAAGGATRGDPFLFSPLGHSREARAPTRCRPIGPRRPSTNTRAFKRVRTAAFHRVTFPKVTSRSGLVRCSLPVTAPPAIALVQLIINVVIIVVVVVVVVVIVVVVVVVVVVVIFSSPPPRDSSRPRGLRIDRSRSRRGMPTLLATKWDRFQKVVIVIHSVFTMEFCKP